jgi:hypothetical protein
VRAEPATLETAAKPAGSGLFDSSAASLLLGLGAWILTSAAILSTTGSRMLAGLDEGIYLSGAGRVLAGSLPYRDFLSFVGPAIFLEYAAVLGIDHSLFFAHFVLAAVIGLTSGVLVYLCATSARRFLPATAVAVVAVLLWLGELQFWKNKVYVDHRWHSTAMTLLAFAIAHVALRRRSWRIAVLAGCALGIAVTYTPSAALFAGALVGYLLLQGGRKLILALGGGFAIPLMAMAVWLLSTHSIMPYFADMAWAFQHYPQPNTAPYGYLGTGSELTAGPEMTWLWLAYWAILRITPALPIMAGALLLVVLITRRSRECAGLLLVLGAAVAMVAPRFSADHLLFASPIAIYCIAHAAFALGRTNRWIPYGAGMVGLAFAGLLFLESERPPSHVTEVRTALGTVICRPDYARELRPVLERVGAEDSLFVYPYFPLLYALTGARDPSSYLFVQPGMMGDDDMAKVARELRGDLPKYIVHVPLTDAEILHYWPGTQRITSTSPIDAVVAEHYRLALRIPPEGEELFVRK